MIDDDSLWDSWARLIASELGPTSARVIKANAKSPENQRVQPDHSRARAKGSGHYRLKVACYRACERCGSDFPVEHVTTTRFCSRRCKKAVWQRNHAEWWNAYRRRRRAEQREVAA